jgi:hypothetical protein
MRGNFKKIMMIKYSFAIVLSVVFAATSAQQSSEWKSAHLGKYVISYPENWGFEMGKDEIDSTLFNPYSPASGPNDIFRENVSISKHRRQNLEDINKDAEATIAYLKSAVPEFNLIDSEISPVGEFQKCFTLTYSGLMNNTKWRFYTRIIYADDFFYNFIMTSPDEDFERFLPEAKGIFNSFHVLGAGKSNK